MEKERAKLSGPGHTRHRSGQACNTHIYIKRIKESEEKYRALVNDASDVILLADLDGRILEVNKKAEQVLGYTKEELLAMRIWTLHAPEDYPIITAGFQRLVREGSASWPDGSMLRKDGQRIPIDLTASTVTYNGQEAYQAIIRDITERKVMEEELRRSRELYRCVVQDQNDLICRYSTEGILTFVNDAYCRYFEKSREELLGSSFLPLIPQEDHLMVQKTLAALSPSSPVVTYEHRVISPEGMRWMEWCNRIVCDERGKAFIYQAVGRDVTQRKKLEKQQRKLRDDLEREVRIRTAQLREEAERLSLEISKRKEIEDHLTASEERYRGVVDHIDIGIALISPAMEILTLNKKMWEWFPACDPQVHPLCYRTFNDPPRETVCPHCPTKLTLEDGNVHQALIHTPRGNEIRQYCITTSPLKGRNGELLGAIEMVDDVSEVMRAKGRLEETERRYQTIFESTGTAMMIIGNDMNVLEVNREFEKQSGYTKTDIEGKKAWMEFVMPEDLQRLMNYYYLRLKNPKAAPSAYEFGFRNSRGEVRYAWATVSMIPGTDLRVSSLIDITDQKHAEDQLKKRERSLERESRRLKEANIALKVLLKQRTEDQGEMEKKVLSNVRKLVLPYMAKLKKTPLSPLQLNLLQIAEKNLQNVISPFLQALSAYYPALTPRETDIVNLVKEGKTAKEIADLLNASIRSVEFHKNNIRQKLGLRHQKTGLRTYLLSLK